MAPRRFFAGLALASPPYSGGAIDGMRTPFSTWGRQGVAVARGRGLGSARLAMRADKGRIGEAGARGVWCACRGGCHVGGGGGALGSCGECDSVRACVRGLVGVAGLGRRGPGRGGWLTTTGPASGSGTVAARAAATAGCWRWRFRSPGGGCPGLGLDRKKKARAQNLWRPSTPLLVATCSLLCFCLPSASGRSRTPAASAVHPFRSSWSSGSR